MYCHETPLILFQSSELEDEDYYEQIQSMRMMKYGEKQTTRQKALTKMETVEEAQWFQQKIRKEKKGKKKTKKNFVIPEELIHPEVLNPETNKLKAEINRFNIARYISRGLMAAPNSVITAAIIKSEQEARSKTTRQNRLNFDNAPYEPRKMESLIANELPKINKNRQQIFTEASKKRFANKHNRKVIQTKTVEETEIPESLESLVDAAELEETYKPKKKRKSKKKKMTKKPVKKSPKVVAAEMAENIPNCDTSDENPLETSRPETLGEGPENDDEKNTASIQGEEDEKDPDINATPQQEQAAPKLPAKGPLRERKLRPPKTLAARQKVLRKLEPREPTFSENLLEEEEAAAAREAAMEQEFQVDPNISIQFETASEYIWNIIRQKRGMQLHSAIMTILQSRGRQSGKVECIILIQRQKTSVTLPGLVKILMKILWEGEEMDQCEAVRAMLFLYRTFQSDFRYKEYPN